MQVIFERLLEVAVAMVLAGAVLMVISGITSGAWSPFMLVIVPLGFMWSMFLGAMAAADISRGLFLLVAALTVLVVYLVARFVRQRPLRIAGETAAFGLQQFVLMNLFAMQGLTS
jgi:hypothetical protein